jgi:aryl-alcohol dehydrogenase-like predicted oxidoreductase
MQRRRFGRTGLDVPELTFGGGWVGGLLIRGSEQEREAVLNRALQAGIDWIDTAALYGNGVSETVIGGWLRGVAKEKRPRISTKFNIDTTAGDFAGQIERSGPGWNSSDFDGLLHRCAAQNMGVMGIRIFAAGHLATSERHGREVAITTNAEDAAEETRAKAALDVLGSQYGTGAQAALRFGLACPLLSTIVVGIGETWHLDEALAAAEMGPLPAPALKALEDLRRQHPAFRS